MSPFVWAAIGTFLMLAYGFAGLLCWAASCGDRISERVRAEYDSAGFWGDDVEGTFEDWPLRNETDERDAA